MAKKIEWTQRSVIDRIQIYEYWRFRNKSTVYSERVETMLSKAVKLLSEFPELGIATNQPNVRVKIVLSFKIF
jgi:hypothetical protein